MAAEISGTAPESAIVSQAAPLPVKKAVPQSAPAQEICVLAVRVLWRRLMASVSLIVLVPAEEPLVLQPTNRSLSCFG